MRVSAVPVLLPVTICWVAAFIAHAFAVRREQKYRDFWGAALIAIAPALLSALYLTADPEVGLETRNVTLGIVGGILGAVAAIWLGYLFSGPSAGAQPVGGAPPSAPPSVEQHNQSGPNFNVPGTGNQFFLGVPPPAPEKPARDPDGIRQFDRKVARVE
jgi:hypothetical protein